MPLIYPISGLTVYPRSTLKVTPLELTDCNGLFTVSIHALYGRVSLPKNSPSVSTDQFGQPGISLANVTAFQVNSWFSDLYYQNVMFDARPYTDFIILQMSNDLWSKKQIVKMAVMVGLPPNPRFMPGVQVREDLTYKVPRPDDFEMKTTIVLKVRLFPSIDLPLNLG